MDWILDNVAVSSWRDAADPSILIKQGITAILNVRADEGDEIKKQANEKEKQYCRNNGINYCYLPVPDFNAATTDQLIRGVAFIERSILQGRKVLVHCGEGLGRSPSFIAAYLVFKGYDAKEAIDLIRNRHRGSFEGGDRVHIPRIEQFARKIECI